MDSNQQGRYKAWKLDEKRRKALTIADIALSIALTSPSLEVCSLAARGLRLLALVENDPDAPPPEQYTYEQSRIRVSLLDAVGDPKIVVLGRVEFQKRLRLTLFPAAFPCITHLAMWRELYYRWVTLTPIVTGATNRSSTDSLVGGSSDGGPFSRLTTEVSLVKSVFSNPLLMFLHRKDIWHGKTSV